MPENLASGWREKCHHNRGERRHDGGPDAHASEFGGGGRQSRDQRVRSHQFSKIVTAAVRKMIPSAMRESCLCSRDIISNENSTSTLMAARSIRSGSGRGTEKR